MYITQETDYAVRIVHCLAKAGVRRDARSISEEVDVTLRFSLKILGKLSGAGIVNSFKGNRGGYELARPADKVTLKDVFAAVEGPYAMSRCVREGEDCNCINHGSCTFQNVYNRISDNINEQLDEITFEKLMEEERECNCAE